MQGRWFSRNMVNPWGPTIQSILKPRVQPPWKYNHRASRAASTQDPAPLQQPATSQRARIHGAAHNTKTAQQSTSKATPCAKTSINKMNWRLSTRRSSRHYKYKDTTTLLTCWTSSPTNPKQGARKNYQKPKEIKRTSYRPYRRVLRLSKSENYRNRLRRGGPISLRSCKIAATIGSCTWISRWVRRQKRRSRDFQANLKLCNWSIKLSIMTSSLPKKSPSGLESVK